MTAMWTAQSQDRDPVGRGLAPPMRSVHEVLPWPVTPERRAVETVVVMPVGPADSALETVEIVITYVASPWAVIIVDDTGELGRPTRVFKVLLLR
jgi:hypothetical protein